MRLVPSTLLPSSRNRPTGSSLAGISAVTSALLMILFNSACLDHRPALFLHFRPCLPFSFTTAPQTQTCDAQMSTPKRKPTTMRKVLLSSSVPMVRDGKACSHAPVLASILPQCVSPNDILRNKSSNCFYELVKHSPSGCDELIELKEIFKDVKDEFTFKDYATSFGLFVQILDIERFRTDLLKGYVLTTGGFEFSSVNSSREALLNYLKKISQNQFLFESIQYSLYKLLVDNAKDNRYPITIIKTYDYLFTTSVMDSINKKLLSDILDAIWNQIRRSEDVKKIFSGSVLICSMLRFKDLRNRCLVKLMMLLCSRFPNVRNKTADTLYSNLLIFGDLILDDEDKLEEVMRLLLETAWSGSDSIKLKEVRKRICELMNVPEPMPLAKQVIN